MVEMTLSTLTHLACSACGAVHPPDQLQTICRQCGKVLLAQYDLDRARRTMTPAALRERPFTMWRYAELLPVQSAANIMTLGEGGTPLLVKDEGLNPTASFKARGLSMAVSRARELGATALAIPSAGNAGSALAAYAARAGLPAVIFVPADTPSAMIREARAFGAQVVRV